MRISDWSSDVCSSDLVSNHTHMAIRSYQISTPSSAVDVMSSQVSNNIQVAILSSHISNLGGTVDSISSQVSNHIHLVIFSSLEEHTSEPHTIMRITSALLSSKNTNQHHYTYQN